MFTTKIKTRFFEADPVGIIFYGNFFQYVHTAYEEFINSLKLKINFFNDYEYALPIIHAKADYKAPVRFGEIITVNIIVTKLKKSSFELSYEILNQKNIIVTKIKTVHVCVYKNNFKKTLLPKELFDSLKDHYSTI
ncbi:MAG: acyl-CoA thioesterase [Melioribacter sp.]|nr:acyl-CoA thioesterase [Melioribacter sp.]